MEKWGEAEIVQPPNFTGQDAGPWAGEGVICLRSHMSCSLEHCQQRRPWGFLWCCTLSSSLLQQRTNGPNVLLPQNYSVLLEPHHALCHHLMCQEPCLSISQLTGSIPDRFVWSPPLHGTLSKVQICNFVFSSLKRPSLPLSFTPTSSPML